MRAKDKQKILKTVDKLVEYNETLRKFRGSSKYLFDKILRECNKLVDEIDIFDMPCKSLPNYLSVTLTPSNSIFHTSRLYSLFKNWHEGITYSRNIMFHEEWNDEVSEIMIE